MEHTRATKSWSKHNLPLDLWQEILSWRPVKSLLRFRCVTKSWKRLIEDPDFCYLRSNRFKNNTDETHLLCVEKRRYGHIRCSETFETTGRPFKAYSSDWFILLLFDGLVLLKSRWGDSLLWNPSIRKCRRRPPLSYLLRKNTIELGLGFDPLARDYKLLSMCLSKSVKRPVVIYTVGTNSWTNILFQARGYNRPSWEANGEPWLGKLKLESVNYKGCLYFISRNGKELVSFDLSKTVFTFANLPAYKSSSTCFNGEFNHSLVLVDGGRSLAVLQASAIRSSLWAVESSNSDATTLLG